MSLNLGGVFGRGDESRAVASFDAGFPSMLDLTAGTQKRDKRHGHMGVCRHVAL